MSLYGRNGDWKLSNLFRKQESKQCGTIGNRSHNTSTDNCKRKITSDNRRRPVRVVRCWHTHSLRTSNRWLHAAARGSRVSLFSHSQYPVWWSMLKHSSISLQVRARRRHKHRTATAAYAINRNLCAPAVETTLLQVHSRRSGSAIAQWSEAYNGAHYNEEAS